MITLSPSTVLPATKATVLVVDDEPITSALLKEFLMHLGLDARFAANGIEAQSLIEARPPNLIILDLNMPRMGGLELLQWTRKRWPATLPFGIIVLTGLREEALLEEALALGATDVLTKPVTLQHLELAVQVQLTLQPSGDATPEVSAGADASILLVEDDENTRSVMKLTLEQQGYQVHLAKDGEQALTLCLQAQGAIDLLITDVVIPTLNGLDLAQVVRERWPNTKVLLYSGQSAAFIPALEHLPHTPFLNKPFDFQTLLTAIRQILSKT